MNCRDDDSLHSGGAAPGDRIELDVHPSCSGQRVRVFLGDALPLEPKDFLRMVLADGHVLIDDEPVSGKNTLRGGERVVVEGIEAERAEYERVRAENEEPVVRLTALYEDETIVVFDKPAGFTVVRERSSDICPFQSGVLDYLRRSPSAEAIRRERYRPRAVHRLDRDTTGAVIIAKARAGELHLAPQFQERTVKKEYLCVVAGEMPDDRGTIEAAIAERPGNIERMDIDAEGGKESVTRYEVLERFRNYTFVRAEPLTGRRHQIRIHLAHLGYPIICDRVYGGGSSLLLSSLKRRYVHRGAEPEKPLIARTALHAAAITFLPVGAAAPLRVEAPLPRDMGTLVKMLRKYAV